MKNYNIPWIYKDRADLPERHRYVKSIEEYINGELARSDKEREDYTLLTDTERRRRDFIFMHGYPLTEYETLSSKPVECVQNKYYCSNDHADYYRMILKPFGNVEHYGILMLPKKFDASLKYPFVIVNHGANDGPEMVGSLFGNSFNYGNCGIRFTERNCVVYAPQMLTWEPKTGYNVPYDRHDYDLHLRQLGGSFTGFELLAVKRIIDYFTSLDYIDADRIGYAGLSWGGMYALHAGAADKRIKSVLVSCFFSDRKVFDWADWCYKEQARKFFDAEVASLVLPRYLAIENGANDPLFKREYAEREFTRLKRYAGSFLCEDKLFFNVFNGGHEFNVEEDTMDWFADRLIFG